MDKIQFVIENSKDVKETTLKVYDVSVYLNEKKLPYRIFNAPMVLPLYLYGFAKFDLFTCNCGVAGCAGFHEEVVQNVKDNIVKWDFPKGNYYNTEKLTYEFDKNDFIKELKKLKSEMLQLEKNDNIQETLLIDESYYIEEIPAIPFKKASLQKQCDWYSKIYKNEEKFKKVLNENFPHLVNKDFKYIYDGVESKEGFDLDYLVCRVLNQFPNHRSVSSFLGKVKKAGKAIEKLLNGDRSDFDKIVLNSYEKNEMSSHCMIVWYFNDVKEEDFDLKKLSVK